MMLLAIYLHIIKQSFIQERPMRRQVSTQTEQVHCILTFTLLHGKYAKVNWKLKCKLTTRDLIVVSSKKLRQQFSINELLPGSSSPHNRRLSWQKRSYYYYYYDWKYSVGFRRGVQEAGKKVDFLRLSPEKINHQMPSIVYRLSGTGGSSSSRGVPRQAWRGYHPPVPWSAPGSPPS